VSKRCFIMVPQPGVLMAFHLSYLVERCAGEPRFRPTLVNDVEICLRPGRGIKRAPDKAEQNAQGLRGNCRTGAPPPWPC
jgi:hypothetical protein